MQYTCDYWKLEYLWEYYVEERLKLFLQEQLCNALSPLSSYSNMQYSHSSTVFYEPFLACQTYLAGQRNLNV